MRQGIWEEIRSPRAFPNSAYGLLRAELEGITYSGSGVMIGERLVLTAGSNLFSRLRGTNASKLVFFPGYEEASPGLVGHPIHSIIHEQYADLALSEKSVEKYNVGIVVLKERVDTRWLDIQVLEDKEFEGKTATIVGYPQGNKMYKAQGPIKPPTPTQIIYDIGGEEGLVGAGGSIDGEHIHFIHTSGVYPSFGTRITQEIINWVEGIRNHQHTLHHQA